MVDFVENDEAVFKTVENGPRFPESQPFFRVFKVEVRRVLSPADFARQRRLADLPRPDENDGRLFGERLANERLQSSFHVRIFSIRWRICKDESRRRRHADAP